MVRAVEAQLLTEAASPTVVRLRKRAVAALLEVDADAVDERREQAERHADVRVHPSPREGMSTLATDLPSPVAAACYDVIDRLAVLLKQGGDDRPIGQVRTEVLADLIQRPWDTTRPATTAHLQVIASLSALAGRSREPGEVDGLPITIGQLRQLLTQLDALGVRAPEGGSMTLALAGDEGALRATATLDQLRRLARRGCPDHPDTDHPDGRPDGPEDARRDGTGASCRCAVLDRPQQVNRYTPSPAQQTFVHTRDRTCRFPTCGQRVGWADADHVIAHACGGVTDCANLCCLCHSHHRLETHARGWRFTMTADGVLTVTTPSGTTRTTRPPGMRPPAEDPAPDTAGPMPPDGAGPPPPADPDDELPPF